NVGPLLAEDLGGFGVSLPVRLEIAGLLDRDDVIERKADMRPGRLEHVAVTIRENGELVSLGSKLFECRSHIGEWLELLDLAHEPPRFVRRVPDAAAIHHVRHRALSDLPIGRVPAIAQRVDHRVLEVGAAPPGDEAVRPAARQWHRTPRSRSPRARPRRPARRRPTDARSAGRLARKRAPGPAGIAGWDSSPNRGWSPRSGRI